MSSLVRRIQIKLFEKRENASDQRRLVKNSNPPVYHWPALLKPAKEVN